MLSKEDELSKTGSIMIDSVRVIMVCLRFFRRVTSSTEFVEIVPTSQNFITDDGNEYEAKNWVSYEGPCEVFAKHRLHQRIRYLKDSIGTSNHQFKQHSDYQQLISNGSYCSNHYHWRTHDLWRGQGRWHDPCFWNHQRQPCSSRKKTLGSADQQCIDSLLIDHWRSAPDCWYPNWGRLPS